MMFIKFLVWYILALLMLGLLSLYHPVFAALGIVGAAYYSLTQWSRYQQSLGLTQ